MATPPIKVKITNVSFTPTTVKPGGILTVTMTVVNTSRITYSTQGPAPGFTYNEGQTFETVGYPSINNRIRVGVNYTTNTGVVYPYRWGTGVDLAPGAQVQVTGYIVLTTELTQDYWAGLILEPNVVQDKVGTTSITVRTVVSLVVVDPTTRLEGHLGIKVELGTNNVVTDAKCVGAMFRGIESILNGRSPRDAEVITQRICGVCPISHGQAASLCLENAGGTVIPANGRIMRNLIQGSNYIQSHVLHFYHLAALDYVKGPEMPPWTPFWDVDYRLTPEENNLVVTHYREALTMRRKAHEMGAILGGKLPHAPAMVAGGCAEDPDVEFPGGIAQFRAYLNELIGFIDNTYLPDVNFIASKYSDYSNIGVGCKNLLSYGVFDIDAAGTKLLSRGRIVNAGTTVYPVDQTLIKEYVKYSYYPDADTGLHPSVGVTNPLPNKSGAYSWLKAPRYNDTVYEVGPLARMWVNGDYRAGIGVMHRHAARAKEAQKVAYAMLGWLDQIVGTNPYFVSPNIPAQASGVGMTEAPRGALGHWETISNSVINNYQCVVPTTWNASPMDDMGQHGTIEQALIGTTIYDPNRPIEILRIVHSFDPCIACAVHLIKPNGEVKKFIV